MHPTIKKIREKKLAGKRLTMTFADNKTVDLWRSFMPRRKEIKNNVNNELISMQVYDASFSFSHFNPQAAFQKWAAVEVTDFRNIPDDMETFTLSSGLYAVFHYKGLNTDTKIFEYIFSKWLPSSDYTLDQRPHFEILGEKYRNNDPLSEEDICIPLRLK